MSAATSLLSDSEYTTEEEGAKKTERFKCKYLGCKVSFNREWKLNRHICTHTNERPFKCEQGCSKSYRCNSHLQRHYVTAHTQKPKINYIQCPMPNCLKLFSNKYSQKKHMKTHLNEIKCETCGLVFKKHNQLKMHESVHTGVLPYTCKICSAHFRGRGDLNSHVKKRHKIYSCEMRGCSVTFNTWSAMRKHVKLSHFTVFSCDNCSKTFKNKSQLTEHVLCHVAVRDRHVFKCTHGDCEKFYYHRRNLSQHMRSAHNGQRFPCDEINCNKTLATKSKLLQHKLVHDESRVLPKQKAKKARARRKDKGQLRKSAASWLAGISLPLSLERSLIDNHVTPHVENTLQLVLSSIEETLEQAAPPVDVPCTSIDVNH